MERWACADVPCLALQILLDAHPDWQPFPVAVVDRDTAQGVILQVNRNAREFEIRPGIRYAAGLSLSQELRAAVVDEDEIEARCKRIVDALHLFSPDVEPDPHQSGLYWLRATGLDRLFGGFDTWASQLYDGLREELNLHVSVTVGWTRFGTFATSRSQSAGWRVFESDDDEKRHSNSVRLDLLGMPPVVVEKLHKLAIHQVGEFLALPPSGVRKRFGAEAADLWNFAHGTRELPLQSIGIEEPVEEVVELDEAMWDSTRLTFLIKRSLHPLLMELAGRHCDLRELLVRLQLEDGDDRELEVRPATPTLDEARLVELVRLKLDRLSLPAGIVKVELSAIGVPYHRDQGHLFRDNARRDLQAANHALARLQAEYGDNAVCRVVFRDRHLPEATFDLEPLQALQRPSPQTLSSVSLVRRILERPQPLPRFDPDIGSGWLVRDLDEGVVIDTHGPFRISGGWWVSQGVARDYWYTETDRGDIFWVYWDHRRRQWFLHGVVE